MSINFDRIWKKARWYNPLPAEKKPDFFKWLGVQDEKSLDSLTVEGIPGMSCVKEYHLENTGQEDGYRRKFGLSVDAQHRYSYYWRPTQDTSFLRLDDGRFEGTGENYKEAAIYGLLKVWVKLTGRFEKYQKSKEPEKELKDSKKGIKPNPYTKAIIHFPKSSDWKIHYEGGLKQINGNELRFTWGDYLVEATLDKCFIPEALLKNQETNEKILEDIVKPSIVGVVKDLRTAEAVIEETREFAKQGGYEDQLVYEKDINYSNFFVYPENWKMIRKLMAFGFLSTSILKPERQDLKQMATFCRREKYRVGGFSVEGGSLRKALQRNLQIHRAKQKIDKLQITKEKDSLWYFKFGEMRDLFTD